MTKATVAPERLSAAYRAFLLSHFNMTISTDLDKAARTACCGWFGIFRHIILPQSEPDTGVLAILSFSFNWNRFVTTLI